jgi:hypothetical protein
MHAGIAQLIYLSLLLLKEIATKLIGRVSLCESLGFRRLRRSSAECAALRHNRRRVGQRRRLIEGSGGELFLGHTEGRTEENYVVHVCGENWISEARYVSEKKDELFVIC